MNVGIAILAYFVGISIGYVIGKTAKFDLSENYLNIKPKFYCEGFKPVKKVKK